MSVAGFPVDLISEHGALELITERWGRSDGAPLGVASINLDHVHHFGRAGASSGQRDSGRVEWLDLIDGAPIAAAARRLTGRPWPRLAGSDLIAALLDRAEHDGLRVGFLGGADETRQQLLAVLARDRPGLRVTGSWSPARHQVTDDPAARELAAEVRSAGVDLLVVGLGKPRQEVWIDRYGPETGARVLLAFGAVVDFLAGRVSRAPRWVARAGMEWAWRLAIEPRRLARRYLGQGPAAYLASRRAVLLPPARAAAPLRGVRGAVIIPAHDESSVIDRTLDALRPLAETPGVEVIVVCNGSHDDTAERARRHPGVRVAEIAEASKAAALNEGDRLAASWPRIYLDADIETTPDALAAVLRALDGRTQLEAARPTARYDTTGASSVVRAYYRARTRIPSFGHALWGAGVYAVSETGHARFDRFPSVTADDLFIDRTFPASRREVLSTEPVIVRTPRTVRSLIGVLRRGLRAGQDQGHDSTSRTARELLGTARGPRSALDAAIYAAIVTWARRGPGANRAERWERDESSR
jgi:exopolysaccharide biosynthesis WecB/TagA/CpsF family protein